MTLVKRFNNPFYSVFDSFFGDEGNMTPEISKSTPAVNVRENDQAFVVDVVAPGRKREDFKIKLDKDMLTISSEMKESHEEKDANDKIIRSEYRSSSFSRSFSLPQNIDVESIEAKYEDGLLKVNLPKLSKIAGDGSREIAIG